MIRKETDTGQIHMNKAIHILLIEDDKNVSTYTTTTLENSGYKVTAAFSGKEGLGLTASLCPDILLLDLGLPDMDGCEVIRQIRSWHDSSRLPILVISARTREEEKVNALELGADDYLTKPFGNAELIARIRTSLRHRHPEMQRKVYRAKDLEIDFEKHRIRLAGAEIHLTQIEYQLLTLLAENSGRVLTYHHLIRTIWGPYADSNNQILRVNMANIRRKIEQNPAQPVYVFTEIGIGYRMLENEAV